MKLKKVIFSLLTAIIIYSIGILAYRLIDIQRHKNTEQIMNYTIIQQQSLNDYLLASSNGTVHYLFFFSKDNEDARYLKDTILARLNTQTSVDISQIIEIVDLTDLPVIEREPYMSSTYNSTFPSFITLHKENNAIVIDSVLNYDMNQPLKDDELKAWLSANGVYFAS